MKFVFPFPLYILYKSSNFQAKATIQIYLRRQFTQQSTLFICIKAGLKYMQGLKYMPGSAAEWKK